MVLKPVYMDNHATTRVDPRVLEEMVPLFGEFYGNPGSVNHVFGWDAAEAVERSRRTIADLIGAEERELIFTSGATESNNIAIRGVCDRKKRRGSHIITARTEHHAVLDPLARLGRCGFDVQYLPVFDQNHSATGRIDLQQLSDSITDDTCLVSIMLANNEIGVLQELAEINEICRTAGVPLHTDATQAVGRIPIDVKQLGVDLLSFSSHKFYGPKGIGGLYIRKSRPSIRLEPLILGGGQEGGLRSGTLNPPGIVGMASALKYCYEGLDEENERLRTLRDRLYHGLLNNIDQVLLNGPRLNTSQLRLTNNLNVSFSNVDGEALMMSMRDLAVSSGSACSSTNPEPSHVLRAIGRNDDMTRASLRFGLGRFNTEEQVDFAIDLVTQSVRRLRALKHL